MLKIGDRLFEPQNSERVTAYVCGPTVYSRPHLGNLRSAVNFDVLHRVLRRLYGDSVMFVRNFTDIDDKIMDAARQRDVDVGVVTQEAEGQYLADLHTLHVIPASLTPRVTESLPQIVQFISDLLTNEAAYVSEGHVLFDRQRNPEFFLNENLSLIERSAATYKRNPADFVLWKPSRDEQVGWDSPWGRGRPGWHIECSAMIRAHLGETIDIHGGGIDLLFPHHENECAQTHALTGKELARYWMHNGMLTWVDDTDPVAGSNAKMSKSLGNIVTLDMLLDEGFTPEAIRYYLLTAHYTQPLVFTHSRDRLRAAQASVKTLQRAMRIVGPMNPAYTYMGPLLDDLNTPRAIAELHSLANDISAHRATDHDIARFISLLDVMGLHENYELVWTNEIVEIQMARSEARKERDFAEADRLRDILIEMGVDVTDAAIELL